MEFLPHLLSGLAVGAVLGALAGWWLASRRPADQRLEEQLRQDLQARAQEMEILRQQLGEAHTELATARARLESAESLMTRQNETHIESMRLAQEAQQKSLEDARQSFKILSAEALKQSQPELIRLANETLARFHESAKGDLAKRQESIQTLVKPLEEQLKVYQERLAQSQTHQSTALGEVRKQLEMLSQHSQNLAQETQQFRMVLKSNPARGRWGEETLRRVVEAAGLSAHCDFSEQIQAGDSKPDLVVHLPGDRIIIVDSKVPEFDFLQALDTADPVRRSEALQVHANKLKTTIRALAERDYPSQFSNALDYVVLFLPAESLFSAALEGDHDLIVWAAQKHILLATPASLIALLRSVSVSWQQQAQTENAQAIAEAAREFYTRVTRFTEHFERIRSGLERAANAYNDAVGSYERMVRPSGDRLEKLGGGVSGKDLADLQPLEKVLRAPPSATAEEEGTEPNPEPSLAEEAEEGAPQSS